jgi:2-methylcitrate dehydratase PrpD
VHPDELKSKDSASVVITLLDGRTLRHDVEHNKGTPGNPMSDEELEAKFLEAATPVIGPGGARRIADLCWTLEEQDDVIELMTLAAKAEHRE